MGKVQGCILHVENVVSNCLKELWHRVRYACVRVRYRLAVLYFLHIDEANSVGAFFLVPYRCNRRGL
jgi:hypothetical protein